MPRFNFTLALSDEIYDGVIEPLKEVRGVNAFIRRILETYMTNEYVRAIVDGEAVVDQAFEDMLSEAISGVESLSSMSGSMSAQASSSRTAFEERAFAAESVAGAGSGEGGGAGGGAGSADLDAINTRLDNLSSSVDKLVAALVSGSFSGLNTKGSEGAGPQEANPNPVSPEPAMPTAEDPPSAPVNPAPVLDDADSDFADDTDDADDDFMDDFPSSPDSGFDDFDEPEEATLSPKDHFSVLSNFTVGGL